MKGLIAIKTLIELFDSVQIENVIAGLRFKPAKIIYVGFKEVMTKSKMKDIEEFFTNRQESPQIEFEIVGRYDYAAIVERLEYILNNNEDCCFDLTGGKELVITAMGAVSAVRNVPMFQINVKTGSFIRVKNCEEIIETEKSHLTLAEGIQLNGCSITHIEDEDINWTLSQDFQKDIEAIWSISKKNCSLWNKQSNVLESFEKFGYIDEALKVEVNLQYMKNVRQDTMLNQGIINALIKNSLITDYSLDNDLLRFSYKNKQVHSCLTKAGNILELYAYMLMKEIADEEPGYYDDLDIGVYIDWDGVIHGKNDKQKDTKNEVDLMLMRDLVPIFISCKNGEIRKEALYELSVTAQKFGGRYAKKFMLATYVSYDCESAAYITQRAADMGIIIIDNLHLKTRDEFKSILKNRIK